MANNDTKPPLLNRQYAHLNSAVHILQLYTGTIPFAYFLKNFFAQNKKYGSKDRKQIATLCYAYFRLGKGYAQGSIAQRILVGMHATRQLDDEWAIVLKQMVSSMPAFPYPIFSWIEELSETIDSAAFEQSFLQQPDVFLRARPGYEKKVIETLTKASVQFSIAGHTLRLPHNTRLNGVLYLNREVVVQDVSSQKVSVFLQEVRKFFPAGHTITVYDCCAASGGKSILAKDILGNVALTMSDIRPSIIANLKKRLGEAGISNYKAMVVDATRPSTAFSQYDLVIADVPCSGSGTWSRTPEQLQYFDVQHIQRYAALQEKIMSNVIRYVQPKGYLLYITCSVFKKENEVQTEKLVSKGFALLQQQIIAGYQEGGDTMFAALLQKN